MKERKIGYLHIGKLDEAFIGGVMITDIRGLPLEFRYAEPVRPTKIQKILYGKVLERFIYQDVILKNILKEMNHKPDFCVIHFSDLESVQKVMDMPVINISLAKTESDIKAGTFQKKDATTFLLQPQANSHPYRIAFAESVAAQEAETCLQELLEIAKLTDLAEPLLRLNTALKEVCVETNSS